MVMATAGETRHPELYETPFYYLFDFFWKVHMGIAYYSNRRYSDAR